MTAVFSNRSLMVMWFFFVLIAPDAPTPTMAEGKAMKHAPVVIELFTSEGCSSCPAADRLLAKLAAEHPAELLVLSYHVDYWNDLGWKDPFSQARFSERQRAYAQKFSLKSIYTPQVVVNGATEFVGSDEQRFRAAITEYPSLATVQVTATRKDKNRLFLTCSWPGTEPLLLQLALVRRKVTTWVKRGENGGKTLHHVNVVQQLNTVAAEGGTGVVAVDLPPGDDEADYEIIVFTQNKKTLRIEAAGQLAVPLMQ